MDKKIEILGCSIFKQELDFLIKQNNWNVNIEYLDSNYHMRPEALDSLIADRVKNSDKLLRLLFGDCAPDILTLEGEKKIVKIQGKNCIEILLPSERYYKLRALRVFFLLPEWVDRWEEIFIQELGLKNKKICQLFMQDQHSSLCYLNTGVTPIPQKILKEISEYTGLDVIIENVDLDTLKRRVENILKEG